MARYSIPSRPAAAVFDCISLLQRPELKLPFRHDDPMPRVRFIQADGQTSEVDALSGDSVMETAIDNDVEGIIAECGGACSCATCHVYVDPGWLARLPPPEPIEDGMLDCVLDRRPNSRLSCQIRVRDELDGITVTVPDSQI